MNKCNCGAKGLKKQGRCVLSYGLCECGKVLISNKHDEYVNIPNDISKEIIEALSKDSAVALGLIVSHSTITTEEIELLKEIRNTLKGESKMSKTNEIVSDQEMLEIGDFIIESIAQGMDLPEGAIDEIKRSLRKDLPEIKKQTDEALEAFTAAKESEDLEKSEETAYPSQEVAEILVEMFMGKKFMDIKRAVARNIISKEDAKKELDLLRSHSDDLTKQALNTKIPVNKIKRMEEIIEKKKSCKKLSTENKNKNKETKDYAILFENGEYSIYEDKTKSEMTDIINSIDPETGIALVEIKPVKLKHKIEL